MSLNLFFSFLDAYGDLSTYLNSEWRDLLKPALESDNFNRIITYLNAQTSKIIFPPKELIFNALNLTTPEKVRNSFCVSIRLYIVDYDNVSCYSNNQDRLIFADQIFET